MTQRHLTDEKVLPAKANEVRSVILWVIIALALINLASYFYIAKHSYNEDYWVLRYKWNKLIHATKLDWLILGDSSCGRGIVTEDFSKALGKSYNFGTFLQAMILGDEQMIREYIKHNGPPKNVLMVHTYDVWWHNFEVAVVAQTPVATDYLPLYSSASPSRFRFLMNFAVQRWIPLYSQGKSISKILQRPTEIFSPRIQFDKYGFRAEPKADTAIVESHFHGHQTFARSYPYQTMQIDRNAIFNICKLAETNNFDVYYSMSPIYEGVFADSAISARYFQVVDYLKGVEASSPRFHLLGPFPITERKERMQSIDHVVLPAAREFTQTIISRIQACQQQNK